MTCKKCAVGKCKCKPAPGKPAPKKGEKPAAPKGNPFAKKEPLPAKKGK